MAVARGEAGFWHLKAILVLGRPGTGWNQKTIQKKSSRSNSVIGRRGYECVEAGG